jgi:hypothetical protein
MIKLLLLPLTYTPPPEEEAANGAAVPSLVEMALLPLIVPPLMVKVPLFTNTPPPRDTALELP